MDKFGVLGGAILNDCGRCECTHGIAEEPNICTNRIPSWPLTMLIRAEDEDGGWTNHVCCDASASTQRMFPLDVSSLLGSIPLFFLLHDHYKSHVCTYTHLHTTRTSNASPVTHEAACKLALATHFRDTTTIMRPVSRLCACTSPV
jgi:hypothetical protein